MERTWTLMGLALAFLGLAVLAQDQKSDAAEAAMPTPETPKVIRVQVEYIELSHEALTKLLFIAQPHSTDATPLRNQLQEMVAKNEAKVLETQIVVAKDRQKATSESFHSFIYPTGFPPFSPLTKEQYDAAMKELNGPQVCIPITPTAYNVRRLGTFIEVEPTMNVDNRTIGLRMIPKLSWHTGNTVWQEGKDSLGNPFKIQMPDFYTLKINTEIICISGRYTLSAAISPKDAKGEVDMTRKVMIFVKCDVLP